MMPNSSETLDRLSSETHWRSLLSLPDDPRVEESDDLLVAALRRLTNQVGGHVALADAIGANDQTIYQILRGIRHPKSGNKKGVGPSLRARISAKYPDWLDALEDRGATSQEAQLLAFYRRLDAQDRPKVLAVIAAAFPEVLLPTQSAGQPSQIQHPDPAQSPESRRDVLQQ